MKAWFSRYVPRGGRGSSDAAQDLTRDVVKFRQIVHRECARSTRNGHRFTLVLLELGEFVPARESEMLRHVWARVRATDVVGWLDYPGMLGALLFECPKDAAYRCWRRG